MKAADDIASAKCTVAGSINSMKAKIEALHNNKLNEAYYEYAKEAIKCEDRRMIGIISNQYNKLISDVIDSRVSAPETVDAFINSLEIATKSIRDVNAKRYKERSEENEISAKASIDTLKRLAGYNTTADGLKF